MTDQETYKYISGCLGKQKYSTISNARRVIRTLKRHNSHTIRVHAYHCTFCGGWHIGGVHK